MNHMNNTNNDNETNERYVIHIIVICLSLHFVHRIVPFFVFVSIKIVRHCME